MKYMHDLPALSERRYGKTEAYGSNMADGQGIGSPGCNAGVPEQSYKKSVVAVTALSRTFPGAIACVPS